MRRTIYVISDLHLGGRNPNPGDEGSRGFRICTHSDTIAEFVNGLCQKLAGGVLIELVLNGDILDFLAEHDRDTESWSAFTGTPQEAIHKLNMIVARDRPVFDALHVFLDHGGRITLILGNHDIELSLPQVRQALGNALGLKRTHDFHFIYDGEAYSVGDALIEHGNRYDLFNQIDFDALRRHRSLLSRRQQVPTNEIFTPPAGSRIVTEIVNPIKIDYPFVDLLKPEQEAALPMLLALEPKYRNLTGRLARLALQAYRSHGLRGPALPAWGGDIRSERGSEAIVFGDDMVSGKPGGAITPSSDDEALGVVLDNSMRDPAKFLHAIEQGDNERQVIGADIAAGAILRHAVGFSQLLLGRASGSYEERLPALLMAIRSLQGTESFRTEVETETEYLSAAQQLAQNGIRYVIFGHTHKARHVALKNGASYLNSGTWADVLRFPTDLLSLPEDDALTKLKEFVERVKRRDFSAWILFRPTYVRLDLDGSERVAAATLREYTGLASL